MSDTRGEDEASVHFEVGSALLEMGLRQDAIEEFERVLALKPDHAEARRILFQLKSS